MPLQKLQFRPGINREITSLSNKGGWVDCDNVRFRAGFPEKIGGWAALSYNTFMGVARSLWNWVTLSSYDLLGVGTNLKFYVEDGGEYYDITPIKNTTTGTVVFSADTGIPSSVITVVDGGASDIQEGDFITFSGAVSLGGNITAAVLNQEYRVNTILSGTSYTILAREVSPLSDPGDLVLSSASDSGTGGASIVAAYQISTGFDVYTIGTGWGTGGWSRGSWGSGFTSGFGLQLRLWSQSNYGEILLFSPRGGELCAWGPGASPTPDFSARGTIITGTDVPNKINKIMVSDATRIVIAFGCNDYGAYGSTPLDPMLVRWSAQEDYFDWTPSATNQAGSYRLSIGSEIVGAIQSRQEIVIWTDAAVYSMQYLGPPFVWGFTLLADNVSIASQNAMATAGGSVFWMGTDKFYVYSGRVDTLPCTIREYVFSDINRDQIAQFFAGTNERYSEIWWFYCSKDSTEVDKYVIYNYLDQSWVYGEMGRTAWLDSSLRQFPQAATLGNIIVYHEAAVDNGETNPPSPISAYIQSADFDIAEGDNYAFVSRMLPDITFNGSTTAGETAVTPFVRFSLRPKQNPGSGFGRTNSPSVSSAQSYSGQSTHNVQEFTEIIYTRIRAREMSFRVESDSLGTQWQLGTPKMEMRPDGRK